MRLPKFEYFEPRTVDEACTLLAEHREQIKVLAGGTDLLVMMKQLVVSPKYIVNIKRIPNLDYIRFEKDCLCLGALTTLYAIETSPEIQQTFPMLARAAGSVASKQIQSTATLGGNLCLDSKCWYYNQSHTWRKSRDACLKRGGDTCHIVKGGKRCYAVLSGDTIPVLLALGANVKIISSRGERIVPVEDFHTGIGESPNVLGPEEMITEIQVPFMSSDATGAFIKHSMRGSVDFAIGNVAALVNHENGICKDVRIVISAIGPAVVRAKNAEEILKGKKINNEVLEKAGEMAVKDANLVSGAYGSIYYRRKIINVLTKRAVEQAMNVI